MPIFIHIPDLDRNILVLHSLLDQVISHSLEHFHNRNPNSFYFIYRSECHSSTHSGCEMGFYFSLYSTVRPIFCNCLHRHWLKWELHSVITESGKTLFIAQTTVTLKSSFIISGDQKDRQFVTRAVEVEYYRVWTTEGYCSLFSHCRYTAL
jgi:hypothetical protein